MPKVLPKEKSQATPRPGAPGGRIVLGGKERTLRFDFNALAELERETGINALDGSVWTNPSVTITRALLWAGMLHEEPELTIREVGSWLRLDNVEEVIGLIATAYQAAVGREEGEASESSEGEEKN